MFSLEVGAAADIYTADLDGSNVAQITDTEVPERFPSWADTDRHRVARTLARGDPVGPCRPPHVLVVVVVRRVAAHPDPAP